MSFEDVKEWLRSDGCPEDCLDEAAENICRQLTAYESGHGEVLEAMALAGVS